ncbi:MAG: hypothetical protein HZB53_18465 [Chloroflexi bacterium]|nr:hypothetical protein [Chloroflexota bacterium]
MRALPRSTRTWLPVVALVVLFALVGAFVVSVLPGGGSAPGAPPSVIATRIAIVTGTATSITATVALTPTATATLTVAPVVSTTATATPKPTATTAPTATATIAANPVLTTTRSATADWKVYENPEHAFRVKYPPQFAYSIRTPPLGPEILYYMSFYDGSKYQSPFSGQAPAINLAVLANPQKFAGDDWAKAHLFTTPNSVQYTFQFESYQIARTFSVSGIQSTRLTAVSGEGITGHVILIPLLSESKMIYLSYFMDPPALEPLFDAITLTLERTR